jgi:hypothetical protein
VNTDPQFPELPETAAFDRVFDDGAARILHG